MKTKFFFIVIVINLTLVLMACTGTTEYPLIGVDTSSGTHEVIEDRVLSYEQVETVNTLLSQAHEVFEIAARSTWTDYLIVDFTDFLNQAYEIVLNTDFPVMPLWDGQVINWDNWQEIFNIWHLAWEELTNNIMLSTKCSNVYTLFEQAHEVFERTYKDYWNDYLINKFIDSMSQAYEILSNPNTPAMPLWDGEIETWDNWQENFDIWYRDWEKECRIHFE